MRNRWIAILVISLMLLGCDNPAPQPGPGLPVASPTRVANLPPAPPTFTPTSAPTATIAAYLKVEVVQWASVRSEDGLVVRGHHSGDFEIDLGVKAASIVKYDLMLEGTILNLLPR